ncbi:DUF2795 domain-containing protein [Nannocystis pusilla]|uniref:DUF2795 domain-containing protein n=1 Tax=Nannocystis pusilla TaxID=889268 RepID=UPI003DA57504
MTKAGASPIELTHQLRGIDFPVSKKELIRYARDNNADEAVLREMEAMPEQEFRSMRDVTRAMGQGEASDDRSRSGRDEERGRSRGEEREGGEERGRSRGEAREGGEGRSRSGEREGGEGRERARGEEREGGEERGGRQGGRGGGER